MGKLIFRKFMQEPLELFLIAINFLTVLPIGGRVAVNEKKLANSAAFFPLAGALIGLTLVSADFLLKSIFPVPITNLFILIILIIITGALHLDGFVDSVDGLFSGRDRKRVLEIMVDSRAGAFGTIAVVCLLLLKFYFLKEISGDVRYSALIFMLVLSRWGAVCAIYGYPHAETKGAGRIFADLVGMKEFIIATLFTFFLGIILLRFEGLIIWFFVFIILFLLTRWINKKLGGLTGDVYGGIIEIIELLVLIFVYSIV